MTNCVNATGKTPVRRTALPAFLGGLHHVQGL